LERVSFRVCHRRWLRHWTVIGRPVVTHRQLCHTFGRQSCRRRSL